MGKLAGLKQAVNKARRATNNRVQLGYTPLAINIDEVLGDLVTPLLNEYLEKDPEVMINADISLQV